MYDSDKDGIPDQREIELATTYSPILRLDSDELFFPVTIRAYANFSILENKSVEGFLSDYEPVVIRVGDHQIDYSEQYGVIYRKILKWVVKHPAYYRINLIRPTDGGYTDIDPSLLPTNLAEYRQLQDLMMQKGFKFNVTYVNVEPFELYNRISGQYEEFIGIQYWFAYILNYHPLAPDHEFDWEHITVVLDRNTLEPLWVILSQHSWKEYRFWNEMDRISTHPVIYVAEGSHASYKDSGGIIDDHDGNGAEIRPDILMLNKMLWVRFPGYWIDVSGVKEGWLHWRLDIVHEDFCNCKEEEAFQVGAVEGNETLIDFIYNTYAIHENLNFWEEELFGWELEGIDLNTSLTIAVSDTEVEEGEEITITGRLMSEDGKPISLALIKLYDDDLIKSYDEDTKEDKDIGDDFIACGFTDNNGYYKIRWRVEKMDCLDDICLDNTIELYAKFDGMYVFNGNRSSIVYLTVL